MNQIENTHRKGQIMGRTRVTAILLGLAAVATITSQAWAVYHPTAARFLQRDPVGYADGMSLYEYITSSPAGLVDWAGAGAEPTTQTRGAGEPLGIPDVFETVKLIDRYAPDYAGADLMDAAIVGAALRVLARMATPPSGGASRFEEFISRKYLACYCALDPMLREVRRSKAIDAIAAMTREGQRRNWPGLSDQGLLEDYEDWAGAPRNVDDDVYWDTDLLLGDPNDRLADVRGFLQDLRWQGPNKSNLMHFAGGIRVGNSTRGHARFFVHLGFIGYEITSGEGWEQLGFDAINDVIAEEAGRLFGRDLRNAMVKCDPNRLIDLDPYLHEGRKFAAQFITWEKLVEVGLKRNNYIRAAFRRDILMTPWTNPLLRQVIDAGRRRAFGVYAPGMIDQWRNSLRSREAKYIAELLALKLYP
jgi:hypothetical protein